jgi:hypothetical protein
MWVHIMNYIFCSYCRNMVWGNFPLLHQLSIMHLIPITHINRCCSYNIIQYNIYCITDKQCRNWKSPYVICHKKSTYQIKGTTMHIKVIFLYREVLIYFIISGFSCTAFWGGNQLMNTLCYYKLWNQKAHLYRSSFHLNHHSCISSSVVTNRAFHGRVTNTFSKKTCNKNKLNAKVFVT